MKLSNLLRNQRALASACAVVVSSAIALPLPAAEAGGGLEEVIVTAQFREEKLQDTPIAITAVNAELLAARNQTDLSKVAAQAPNVSLTETGGAFGPGMSANIRGIGQGDYIAALEPGVGIYVDDVYYPSLTGANFDLLDLDRVEILRGPQGTLAGRNSEGGAVKIYSKQPQGDGSGSVRGTWGSRNLLDIRAVGDFAMFQDTLFVRVSGVSRKQDGYVTRVDYGCAHPGSGIPSLTQQGDCVLGHEGGKDYSAMRIAFRWMPAENLTVNLTGDTMVDNSEVAANVLQATGPISPFAKIDPRFPWGATNGAQYIPADKYTSYASFCGYRPANANLSGTTTDTTVCWAPTTKTKLWGTNLTIDWKLTDSLAVKSITAYRRFDSRWVEDNDVSPATIGLGAEHQSNHSFSEELRVNGKVGSVVDYTVGAYYFDQLTIGRTHQMLNYVGIPFPFPFVFEFLGNDPTPASSYAGFANVAWHVMDRLNINLGGRYTHEKKDYTYSRIDPVTGLPNILIGGLTGVTGHYDGSKTDYRVNVDYRWTDALMTYASVSTGFKGGGTNPRPFNVLQVHSFNPETLTAYEIGAKTDFLDRRVRLNVAGFFNKFKDIQVTLLACPQFDGNPNGPCAAPVNGGDADIKGVEAELEARPVDRLSIEGSWSKLSFKYTRIDPLSGIPDGALAPGDIEDKWSAAIQYEFPLAGGGSITPRYDHTYQGGYNTNAIPTPGNRVAGRHLDNAQITWKSADDKWQASLIGSNLADKYYYVSVFDLTGLGGGTNYGFVAPPREFSVQVQKKF
jgi:iron complex outermembrane receptor protein